MYKQALGIFADYICELENLQEDFLSYLLTEEEFILNIENLAENFPIELIEVLPIWAPQTLCRELCEVLQSRIKKTKENLGLSHERNF